ncbi:putative clathrin assembly protein [Platanthera zijinensis]|uniref:Clathrin assembly protein n=1 Tax=Platanthera zijinensis TaxID=2320716 RepID=A0AAP0BYM7_9ASPA
MGRKLRRLIGALKDNASIAARSTILCPSSSSAADLAVLRATSHHHPSSPPHPRHIAGLLSFGRGARPVAAALAFSLSSRLLTTTDPTVALKSLFSLHQLLRSAPFILLDQLSSYLLPQSSGRRTRSPLLLSSFPLGSDPFSWSLSSFVRWYSRLLELLLLLPSPSGENLAGWASSLLTRHLISEIESLANFVAEAFHQPEIPGNRLISEVERMVAEDRLAAEDGIMVRLGEVRERLEAVGFADSVDLVFVLRRLEDHRPPPWMSDVQRKDQLFWTEVRQVRETVEGLVVKREREARSLQRDGFISARFMVRTGDLVQFHSNRWVA